MKTANVVVSYSGRKYVAKICDFGVSRRIDDLRREHMELEEEMESEDGIAEAISKKTTDFILGFEEIERTVDVGTPAFLAPEILMKLVKKKGWHIVSKQGASTVRPKMTSDYSTDGMVNALCHFIHALSI